MAEAKFTTDHDEIREWAEARGGRPAAVRKTHGKDDPGIIRIEFPDAPNAKDGALGIVDDRREGIDAEGAQ